MSRTTSAAGESMSEEAKRAKQAAAAIEAGQAALEQYKTPHTRRAAEIAAKTVQAALQEDILPQSNEFIHGLTRAAIANAHDELGQYFQPHARQAAEVASTQILRQNGYLTHLNQGQGEQ